MLSKLIQKQKDVIKGIKGDCKAKRIENDVLTLTYSYSTQELYDGPVNVIGYFVTDRGIEITTYPIKLARHINFTATNGWKLIGSENIKIFDIDEDKKTIYLPTDKNNSTHSVTLNTDFCKDRYYNDPMVTDIGVLISEFLASIS